MPLRTQKGRLDRLYAHYNRRRFVHPDPLEFLYDYPNVRDREIVALIASSLAYGRVSQILSSVRAILERMAIAPARFVERSSDEQMTAAFAGFKHRFTTGHDMADLLRGVRSALVRYGSLERCFEAGLDSTEPEMVSALARFAEALTPPDSTRPPGDSRRSTFRLLSSPSGGSACKRLNLFLRWMVRQDAVDPGGWHRVPAEQLIIPLDTHMYRISRVLRLTSRKAADLRTAREITSAFRVIAPEDPVRYDFALTRLGIRRHLETSNPLDLFGDGTVV